jgi:hypothetical protein
MCVKIRRCHFYINSKGIKLKTCFFLAYSTYKEQGLLHVSRSNFGPQDLIGKF